MSELGITMERQIARTFNEKVEAFIECEDDRELLYRALANYHGSHELAVLVLELRTVINCPGRMILYDEIRPLIPLKHQMDYDQLIPQRGNNDLRTVRLKRGHNEGLGFAVRGGLEHGIGLFVSHVVPHSPASKQNIKVGDEIVRVNGFTINQAIHQEALHLIKSRRDLVLRVRSVGLIPVKDHPSDKLSWSYVINGEREKILQQIIDGRSTKDDDNVGNVVKLYIDVAHGTGLGCSITSGPSHHPGIFIQSVRANSLAQQAGLRVGDQILEVNGTSFINVKHSEAVVALKSSRHLDMRLRRGVGLPLFQSIKQAETGEEERAREMREDAAVSEAIMEQVFRMEDNKEAEGREVTIHIEDQSDHVHLENHLENLPQELKASTSGFGDGVSQPSTLSSSASSTTCSHHTAYTHNQSRDHKQQWKKPNGQDNVPLYRLHRNEEDNLSMQEKQELQRLKRDYLAGKENQSDPTRPSPPSSLTVATEPPTHTQLPISDPSDYPTSAIIQDLNDQSPVFLQPKPAFRFQKPVLLSPVKSEDASYTTSNSSPTPEEPINITEDNFNPSHLFTNEQIAGRQVQLLTFRKSRHQVLGLEIAAGSGQSRGRTVVSQIIGGSTVQRQGGLHVGDQILMVDGVKVDGMPVDEVRDQITEAFSSIKANMQIVVAKAPPLRRDEEIVWFV